jgi:hypothetical protein
MDDAPLIECLSYITSPYVPRCVGAGLTVVAPEDDEAGRMMVRPLMWAADLPQGWSASTPAFEALCRTTEQALQILAGDAAAMALVRMTMASIVVADHPKLRAGVCSASLSHTWISPRLAGNAGRMADVLLSAGVHHALYADELLHAKWAVEPEPLDTTQVTAPVRGTAKVMEYDSAFHAVHVEYMRLRGGSGSDPAAAVRAQELRRSISELLAYPSYLSDHGKALLVELDTLTAELDAGPVGLATSDST